MSFLADIGLTPAEARHVFATNPPFVNVDLRTMAVGLLKDELDLSPREVATVLLMDEDVQ